MKMIYSLAALAFLAGTAHAEKCWPVTGNWVNASTKSCELPGGGGHKHLSKCEREPETCHDCGGKS